MKFRGMHNNELLELLFTDEDRLPRTAVNEMIRRSDEIIQSLSAIVMGKTLWTANLPEWWAPVHATYILGAIGSKESVIPLFSSLKWADAFDNEWVVEDMPSIMGSLGTPVIKPLERLVLDRSEGWSARSVAIDSLAAVSIRNKDTENHTVEILSQILGDKTEEPGVRRSAAVVLMDLRRKDCKNALIKFFAEEEKILKQDPFFSKTMNAKDIEKQLSISEKEVEYYLRDWLEFYDPAEIKKRQERWAEEEVKLRGRTHH